MGQPISILPTRTKRKRDSMRVANALAFRERKLHGWHAWQLEEPAQAKEPDGSNMPQSPSCRSSLY